MDYQFGLQGLKEERLQNGESMMTLQITETNLICNIKTLQIFLTNCNSLMKENYERKIENNR